MCFLRPRWSRATMREARAQAQRNLIPVFGGSLSEKRIRAVAHDFAEEQVRRDIDLELLSELPELEAGRWLRRYCVFHGLEHLDSALVKRQGVLLSSFHFSSSHLLVLLLWLRGYSFTGAGGIPWKNHNRVLPSDNPELAAQLKSCGDVKWYATFTLESALKICRTVNQGGMGLVFPDGIAARAKGDLATYFGHDAARYKRAQCEVPFLGRVVQGNTGVPWIYKQSKAPLIPIKLVRDSFHRFQVIVGPEIKLDRAASVEKITADLYGALEREILVDPSDWIYWRILNQFTTAS
jgi:lauroyl/myristoyl acyltransferase